jgi:hypothetical protein
MMDMAGHRELGRLLAALRDREELTDKVLAELAKRREEYSQHVW